MIADAVQNDSETAKKLSFAWLQSSTIEELELRLAIAGVASLDAAAEAWSRENKDMLKIIYKNFLDEKQEKIDLKKLMKSRSNAAKLLPSKSTIEDKDDGKAKEFCISMYAVDTNGKMHVVRSSYFDESDDIAAFLGGRDAFEAELAWNLLFELAEEMRVSST